MQHGQLGSFLRCLKGKSTEDGGKLCLSGCCSCGFGGSSCMRTPEQFWGCPEEGDPVEGVCASVAVFLNERCGLSLFFAAFESTYLISLPSSEASVWLTVLTPLMKARKLASQVGKQRDKGLA
eukprot:266062-Pelagomonas_calceolata.AAC.4